METTYSDVENGGGFELNYIPELTKLAQENEDFSGNSSKLNGAYMLPRTTYTMGALFAHTSALPLQVSIWGKDIENNMDKQSSFFSYMTNIGYSQSLMIGSEAVFGGREQYFTEHGSYKMYDYNYAVENGLISNDYRVFWGYEDKKLFSFAKEKLLEVSKEDKPFNFTMLTVDTHFEDGYVCDYCKEEFGENRYANVMACSSRQVNEFVEWIQQQDFYENTSIVLVGDHLTMDSDFCNEVYEGYSRKIYTNYINSAVNTENAELQRSYSTFDTFPTTLAALGVEIEGNRLGLGANLFSSEQTLVEKYGLDYVKSEVAKKSDFIERLMNLDTNSKGY